MHLYAFRGVGMYFFWKTISEFYRKYIKRQDITETQSKHQKMGNWSYGYARIVIVNEFLSLYNKEVKVCKSL